MTTTTSQYVYKEDLLKGLETKILRIFFELALCTAVAALAWSVGGRIYSEWNTVQTIETAAPVLAGSVLVDGVPTGPQAAAARADSAVPTGRVVPVTSVPNSSIMATPDYRTTAPSPIRQIAAVPAAPPFVEPDSYNVIPGGYVRFFGSRFQPNDSVTVSVGSRILGSLYADSSGKFQTGWIQVPYAPGTADYVFWGNNTGIGYRVVITVGSEKPWFTLSDYYQGAGAPVTLSGHGFGMGELVRIDYSGATLGTAYADAAGDVEFTFAVPHAGAGKQRITVLGLETGAAASDYFSQAF